MKFLIASVCCFLIVTYARAGEDKLRIFGGQRAMIGQFPHQVSIRNRYGQHFCGGSILSPTLILTAAHCVWGEQPYYITVVSGTNKLSYGGFSNYVAEIIIHPNYKNIKGLNDIAILRLTTSLRYSESAQPVKLPVTDVPENVLLTLSGWGWTGRVISGNTVDPIRTDDLQYIKVKTISLYLCVKQLTLAGITDFLSKVNVCTNSYKGRGGACNGDNGGALVNDDGIQYGIISWGYDCLGTPDVFVNVYNYKGWIEAYLY